MGVLIILSLLIIAINTDRFMFERRGLIERNNNILQVADDFSLRKICMLGLKDVSSALANSRWFQGNNCRPESLMVLGGSTGGFHCFVSRGLYPDPLFP